MISFKQLPAVLLLPLIFFACNMNASKDRAPEDANITVTEAQKTEEKPVDNFYVATDSVASPPAGDNKQQQSPNQTPAAPLPNPDWDKKIVKNANVAIEVKNYKSFNEFVHATARKWGGYIAQEEQAESEYKIENVITIKVPVAQFDNMVNELATDKEKILTKSIGSEDVTGQVIDVRSRMAAKQQARLRYLDLLKQAKNMEEVLQIQNVIDGIQTEIESASGRVNYLTHASAFSTVHLTFFQVLNATAVNNDKPNFGVRVLNALENGLLWVGELLVLLLTLWPLWLALGVALWWVLKMRKSVLAKAQNK